MLNFFDLYQFSSLSLAMKIWLFKRIRSKIFYRKKFPIYSRHFLISTSKRSKQNLTERQDTVRCCNEPTQINQLILQLLPLLSGQFHQFTVFHDTLPKIGKGQGDEDATIESNQGPAQDYHPSINTQAVYEETDHLQSNSRSEEELETYVARENGYWQCSHNFSSIVHSCCQGVDSLRCS